MKFKSCPLFLGLSLFFLLTGCSKEHIKARYYLYKAEQIFGKADYTLKLVKKWPHEKLVPYYQEACDLYLKAYYLDRNVFNLTMIENASSSCWRADEFYKKEKFERFIREYSKAHPNEAEWGDMGMSVE